MPTDQRQNTQAQAAAASQYDVHVNSGMMAALVALVPILGSRVSDPGFALIQGPRSQLGHPKPQMGHPDLGTRTPMQSTIH